MPRLRFPSPYYLTPALAAGIALLAFSLSSTRTASPQDQETFITGRNNTVLFLTDDHNGLSNVHVATSFALLEKYPQVEVHFASFPKMRDEIARISDSARRSQPNARKIRFHELPEYGWVDALLKCEGYEKPVMPPGVKGLGSLMPILDRSVSFLHVWEEVLMRENASLLSPWSEEVHLRLYQHISTLIQEVDPGVVVLDHLFGPALDAATTMNRTRAIISPNALSDAFALAQPYAAALWKYPAITSGFPFPVPLSKIPENVYILLRIAYEVVTSPGLRAKKAFLASHGVRNPLQMDKAKVTGMPWIAASFPEAGYPLIEVPQHVVSCGPIVLDVAPASTQDPKLARWLKRAPTMLINLGKSVKYDVQMAAAMIEAIDRTLLAKADVQVLWKFKKNGDYNFEVLLLPVQSHIANGRLKIETWLKADPTSILQTGDVAVSVHHGGANCFYETVLAGVPQVILPLWFDLYNFAQTAQDLGIGIWPGKETAPVWDARSLSDGFLLALQGNSSVKMREKARALGKVASSYGGRDTAAEKIFNMASHPRALSTGRG